ncbi:hypothetical protein EDB83DRAFT_2678395 [Lactarius deliciosus]|nr:hypothetical protein EDB83DRAFT_2678395 [Lactarius deliciosus]
MPQPSQLVPFTFGTPQSAALLLIIQTSYPHLLPLRFLGTYSQQNIICQFQLSLPPHRGLSSAPDSSVVTGGGGSAKAALNREKDAIYHPSAIRENTTSTSELASQSLSPLSVNDVAIAGPSRRPLYAEHTGDLPHPSHGQYDIV